MIFYLVFLIGARYQASRLSALRVGADRKLPAHSSSLAGPFILPMLSLPHPAPFLPRPPHSATIGPNLGYRGGERGVTKVDSCKNPTKKI